MCQRAQSWRMSGAKNGARKFSTNRKPKTRATPRAISV